MLTTGVALEHQAMKQSATSLPWDQARSNGRSAIVWARPGMEDMTVNLLIP